MTADDDEARAADRLWLELSRAAQGLPMKVDDFEVVAAVVRLLGGEEPCDVSASTQP